MPAPSKVGWIYVLDTGLELEPTGEVRIYKIGRALQLDRRIKQVRVAFPHKLTLSYAFVVSDQFAAEAELHELFAEKRMKGEWFTLDYADLGFIGDYADNKGIIELADGTYVRDPFLAYSEKSAIAAAHLEIEASGGHAIKSKYFPLGRTMGISNELLEIDEEGLYGDNELGAVICDDREREEQEQYEEYLQECEEESGEHLQECEENQEREEEYL